MKWNGGDFKKQAGRRRQQRNHRDWIGMILVCRHLPREAVLNHNQVRAAG